MEWLIFGVVFLAGGVVTHIFFGDRLGPFETQLHHNLALGKRIIISVDDDCYIFQMTDNKVKITRGTIDYSPVPVEDDNVEDFV